MSLLPALCNLPKDYGRAAPGVVNINGRSAHDVGDHFSPVNHVLYLASVSSPFSFSDSPHEKTACKLAPLQRALSLQSGSASSSCEQLGARGAGEINESGTEAQALPSIGSQSRRIDGPTTSGPLCHAGTPAAVERTILNPYTRTSNHPCSARHACASRWHSHRRPGEGHAAHWPGRRAQRARPRRWLTL